MNTSSYATRSEWKAGKHNPTVAGKHIIGLDMGYSAPKGFYESGNFVFPNFCEKINGDLFGKLPANAMIYENAEGERYFVGAAATRGLSEDSVVSEDALYGRNHYLHPEFRVMFETALGMALWAVSTNGEDVFLQTGLPPAYKVKDDPYLRSVMAGTHDFTLTIRGISKHFDITLKDDQIDIMSQPMGTLNSILFNDDGSYSNIAGDIMRNNILVFDAGFRTLDTFFIQNNELKDQTTSASLGMHRILDETRKMISEELGVQVSIPAMQKILTTGYVNVNDLVTLSQKSYSIEEYLNRATNIVCSEALETLKDYIFQIRYLVMTGGTSEVLIDTFSERLRGVSNLTILRGRENSSLPTFYANARGYYMSRYKKMQRENGGR